jgi:predicted nucleotidyltransferase component of viral defense system
LLKRIAGVPLIDRQFALAGGTSLALQLGHRKSVDLDFFSFESFSTTDLEIVLAGEKSLSYLPSQVFERMLFCFIDGVKCDFVHEPFPLIEPLRLIEGAKLFSIPDIAAMKMHTVCGRGKKKDFFDIFALLQKYEWPQLLEWFERKYGSSQLFFLWKSIAYFDDAEADPEIIGLNEFSVPWDYVKKVISEKCH